MSLARDLQRLKHLGTGELVSSSYLNVKGILAHAYRRVSPLGLPSFNLNVEQDIFEDWDYSTDLPSMTVDQFRDYEGFKNKSSPSMIHDELATILMPNKLVAEFKYLGTGSYLRMASDYWSELFRIKAKLDPIARQSLPNTSATWVLMLEPSLRGLFLAQTILGLSLQEVINSESYFDLTSLIKLTLEELKSIDLDEASIIKNSRTKEDGLARLLREFLEVKIPITTKSSTQTADQKGSFPDHELRTSPRHIIIISSYGCDLVSRVLSQELNQSPDFLVSRYLVGPMTFTNSARSTSAIPIEQVLESGVQVADLRMLSLHTQSILLPISLSLDDFKSNSFEEIREYKQSLSKTIAELLRHPRNQPPEGLDNLLKDDWRLIRDNLKCTEAIMQSQQQIDIAALINPGTSVAAKSSRQASKPLEQYYRQLEAHLTKARASPTPVLSRAVLETTQQLVSQVL